MTSILDTNLLTPLSSSLLDPLHPELYGTFGFDSLYPLGATSQPNAFQSPSSSSDNDFSTPPTSPESPPPPSSSSPSSSSPPLDATWIGSVEPPITEAQLNPLLPGYQLNPLPVNARKRRGQVNRKSVRGRGRGGRVPTGRKKSLLSSPPQVSPTTPLTSTPATPSSPTPSKPEDFSILATPDGPVPVDPSQLRELINDAVLKQKRLKRKAELARLSRKKKQLKMSDLEKQVALLREENQKLMMQNATLIAERAKGGIKDTKVQILQPSISVSSQSSPSSSFSPKSLEKAISAINELFLPHGDIASKQVELDEVKLTQLIAAISESFKQNTGSLEASLKQIEEALVPCTAMQFLEWALMQRDKFYQEENGLFMSLFRDEMNATPTQMAQLLRLRTQMQQQSLKMKDQVLVDAFRTFEKVLLQRGRLQQPDAFEQLRAIFTPRQLATYFRYVSQYGSVLIKVPV